MSNRALRFGIAILALGVTGIAGFRFFQQEQRLAAAVDNARAVDDSAASLLVAIADTQAALHAYVAEGQGLEPWVARTTTLIETLRTSTLALEAPAAAAGVPLTDSLDRIDRLSAAEQRARGHVRAGERLLAGELIFTDVRESLDAMRQQVDRVRNQLSESSSTARGAARREQNLVGLAAMATLAVAVLGLAFMGRTKAPVVSAAAVRAAPEEFESSARLIARTPLTPAASATPAAQTATAAASGAGARPSTPTSSTPATPLPRAAIASPPVPAISLRDAAAVCTELGRASQSVEVATLLARGAKVINASGLVVWMTSPDGRELYPAASAGYDERLLARIGNIPRTATNVTAGALRDAGPRTTPRMGQAAASLAVPLLTPLGAVGVLSAELKGLEKVDDARLAVATIFAAQLSTLIGSIAATAGASSFTAPNESARSVS